MRERRDSLLDWRSATGREHGTAARLTGSTVCGYAVEGPIGKGGMAIVYAATHLASGARVALKVLRPTFADDEETVARFEREATLAAAFAPPNDHPNVIVTYETGHLPDGRPFIAMERLGGHTLEERLERGPLRPHQAADTFVQALAGLAAIHAHDIVHRDLKPANVFILRSGRVKLMDFGVSKRVDPGRLRDLTREGVVMGTPFYMSPEQARGRRDIDARSDIYAMGAMLYESLAGRRALATADARSAMHAASRGDVVPLGTLCPELAPALAEVVDRAMAFDRNDRFPDATSFAAALAPFRRSALRRFIVELFGLGTR